MFWLLPLVAGLGTWAATGSFKKGLLAGVAGAATGGIANALGGAGAAGAAGAAKGGLASIIPQAAAQEATKQAAMGALTNTVGAGALTSGGVASMAPGLFAKVPELAAASGAGAGGASGGILAAGLNFAKAHPMATALMGSTLLGAMQKQPKEQATEEDEDIPESMPNPVTVNPYGGNPAHSSTYLPSEGTDAGLDDSIYRYGQYGGEHQFINPTSLADVVANPPEDEKDGPLKNWGSLFHFASGGQVKGPGTGTSDSVPAMGPGGMYALSDGEFILPADVVAALGGGSNDAGSAKLHSMMEAIRTRNYG